MDSKQPIKNLPWIRVRNNFLFSVFCGFCFFWLWHVNGSEVCLRARSQAEDSESFLFAIRYKRFMNDLLIANSKRLDAEVASVFVYDGALQRRAKVVSFRKDGSESNEVSASWVRLDQDDTYLKQIDAHRNNDCYQVYIPKIKDGIYKSQALASGITFRFSCPIKGNAGQVFGYVSYGYKRGVSDLAARVEEARSSALMRVLSN